MCPVLEHLSTGQRLFQPFGLIITQAAEQHQIGAASDNADGIDLQEAHTLNGGNHIVGLGFTFYRG
ncbi:hypothetical protein D3C76_1625130 [compost metagenome]